eukprot:s1251_g20.t1
MKLFSNFCRRSNRSLGRSRSFGGCLSQPAKIVFAVCAAADSPKPSRTRQLCDTANMGSRGSREVHHYHEDKESKEMARKANEQMAAIRSQMEVQERRNREIQEQHVEALRRAEQLHAEERDAFMKRLEAEQEERKRESERAREELEQQAREAEQHLAEELQRERDNDATADAARDRFVNVAMLGDSGTGKSSLIKVILKHFEVELPPDQMPKVSMEGDGTLLPTRFPLEKLGQVSLWDLPGQGTSKIPSRTYLRNMGLKHFDAVCIVTDGRWSEGDDNLLAAIHYAGEVEASLKEEVAEQMFEEAPQEDVNMDGVDAMDDCIMTPCDDDKEVEASLKEEVAEQMFEEAPQEDVNMDAIDAMDDCIMTPCDDDKVEYLRLDIDNQCFKQVGFVKRAGA